MKNGIDMMAAFERFARPAREVIHQAVDMGRMSTETAAAILRPLLDGLCGSLGEFGNQADDFIRRLDYDRIAGAGDLLRLRADLERLGEVIPV